MFICFAFSAKTQIQGVPLLTNYEPSDYNASPQNWGVTQLKSGEILFSNDFGLLIYNGRQWNSIEEEVGYTSHAIKAIGTKIYVGGENNLFTLNSDSIGGLSFNSIIPKLPDSIANFGVVEGIFSFNDKLAFFSDNYIFVLADKGVEFAYSELTIIDMFEVNGQIYVSVEDRGLLRFENEMLVPIVGYQNFIDNAPVAMLPIKGGIKVLTKKKGLFFIEIDTYGYERKVIQVKSELAPIFTSDIIKKHIKLNHELSAVATENNGIYVIKNWKTVVHHLDIDKGLQDEYLHDAYIDNFGSLWLALNNGISKVDISYPVQVFDSRLGLEGMVESIVMHNKQVFAATHAGVYSLDIDATSFKEAIPVQAWDLLSFKTEYDSKLLVATNEDISELTPAGELNTIFECYPWKLHQLKKPNNTVLVGTDPGLTAIKWEDDNWVVGQENSQINSEIGNFTELENKVWLGTRGSRPYYFNNLQWISDSTALSELTELDWKKGMEEGEVNTVKWKNDVLFGSVSGIYQFKKDSFTRFNKINGIDTLALWHRFYNWNDKELWAIVLEKNKFEFGFVNDTNRWNYRLFNPIAKDVVHSVISDQNDNILFGGAAGIHKYYRKQKFNIETAYLTKLSKVSVMEDSVIHKGFWQDSSGVFTTLQPKNSIPEFHYKTNAVAFEYTSLTFGDKEDVCYSYWLVGNDKKWSKWTAEHKKEYTNLKPGDYVFKVKAKNILETESKISEYHFTINKPWFQSPMYYAGQTGVLALLVFLTIYLSHGEKPSPYSSIIAFVTIITVFEFLIMIIEPFFEKFTGEIPVFNLIMNILMAMSLVPVERIIKRYLARKNNV